MKLKFNLLYQDISRYTYLSKGRLKLSLAIALALLFSCILSASAQTKVWQDNFGSTTLNTDRYTYDFYGHPVGKAQVKLPGIAGKVIFSGSYCAAGRCTTGNASGQTCHWCLPAYSGRPRALKINQELK